jgi:hypothetical protein
MVNYSQTKSRLSDILDENVIVKKTKDRIKEDLDAEIIKENTELTTVDGMKITIKIIGENSKKVYLESQYIKFDSNNIGILKWIKTASDARGENMSRIFRLETVKNMKDCNKIYSDIENDKLISIAIDQGFRPILQGRLKGWYVREE